uniref:RING-type domain-containing protein n=1 Tax=Parastrongyloides trichosuri TaxID=131310 RepID=A0A0N4ZJU1_PARTI
RTRPGSGWPGSAAWSEARPAWLARRSASGRRGAACMCRNPRAATCRPSRRWSADCRTIRAPAHAAAASRSPCRPACSRCRRLGGHLHIGADVQADGVGVGLARGPVPGGRAVAVVALAEEAAIHPLRLALRVVDAGPEQVAALALNRAGDPRLAVGRRGPDEAAVPGRALGLMRAAGIGDADGNAFARCQWTGQGDGQPPLGVGPVGDRPSVHGDGGDGEDRVQLDHDGGRRRRGGEVENGDAFQRLAFRQQLERQVRLVETQRQLLGRARRAAGQGEGGGFARRLLRHRGRGQQGCRQAKDGERAQGRGSGRTGHEGSGPTRKRKRPVFPPASSKSVSRRRLGGGLLGQLGADLTLDAQGGDRQLLVASLDDEGVQAALEVQGAQGGVRDTQREGLAQSFRLNLDRLQRRQETALGLDVGVAHVMADHGADSGEDAASKEARARGGRIEEGLAGRQGWSRRPARQSHSEGEGSPSFSTRSRRDYIEQTHDESHERQTHEDLDPLRPADGRRGPRGRRRRDAGRARVRASGPVGRPVRGPARLLGVHHQRDGRARH